MIVWGGKPPGNQRPEDFIAGDVENRVSMRAMADALIEIAVRNGPRAYHELDTHDVDDWDPVSMAAMEFDEDDPFGEISKGSVQEYCTAARALGVL
jgi:hypothetical protein